MFFYRYRASVKFSVPSVRPRRAKARAVSEPLEMRRLLSAALWSGAAGDGQWSNPGNWQGDTVPTAGQDVTFPANSQSAAINLNTKVTVGNLDLEGSYSLAGASVTLGGSVSASATDTIENPVLGQNVNITVAYNDTLTLVNASDGGGGFGITEGADESSSGGTLCLTGTGATYTGQTEVSGGTLNVECPLTSAVLVDGQGDLEGNGQVNGLTVTGNNFVTFSPPSVPGEYLTSTNGLSFQGQLYPDKWIYAGFGTGATSADDFGEIVVRGGVIDIASASLEAGDPPSNLAAGTVVTLISNLTGKPVEGTFFGLPEGSTVDEGSYKISYHGGASGQDVTLTILTPVAWTGSAGDGLWSNPGNWQGGQVPAAGQDVLISSMTYQTTITLSSAVSIGDLTLDGNFELQGGSIMLDGALTATPEGGLDIIQSPLVLENNTPIDANWETPLMLWDVSDGGGHYGIMVGTTANFGHFGSVEIDGPVASYTGVTEIEAFGTLDADCTLASPVQVDVGGDLTGTGIVHGITAAGSKASAEYSATVAAAGPQATGEGISSDDGLTLGAGSTLWAGFPVEDYDPAERTAVPSDFKGTTVTAGAINLTGAGLDVDAVPSDIPPGTVFTLISNSTGKPVIGTFAGFREGATVDDDYQISYAGGASGNDVTLTVLRQPTKITLTSSRVKSYKGEAVTLTASVDAVGDSMAPPTGTVTFYDNGKAIGKAQQMTDGTGNFCDLKLPVGSNSLTATFNGDATFAPVTTTSAMIVTVRQRPPTITSATASVSTHGRTIAASVIGADTGPGGAAGLKYFWTAVHLPAGAKKPTFNVNGTNAARNIVARFGKSGGYVLRCEVKNASGGAVTTDVSVTVGQKATYLKIEPRGAHIPKDGTEQFAGTVLDQFDHPMRAPQTLTYRVASGPGSISSTGVFSATSTAGPVTIELEADGLSDTVGAIVA
jgi:autotransporter-associated beta strand protein